MRPAHKLSKDLTARPPLSTNTVRGCVPASAREASDREMIYIIPRLRSSPMQRIFSTFLMPAAMLAGMLSLLVPAGAQQAAAPAAAKAADDEPPNVLQG